MDDFSLDIVIPRPNDAAFNAGFNNIFRTLDRAEAQLRRIDRLVQRTGEGVGGGGRRGGGRRGGRRGGRGDGVRRGGGNIFGGGSSGNLPILLRAGGIAGDLAIAGGINPLTAALVTAAVTLRSAISLFAQFETQLAEIGRVARFSAEELQNFGDDVSELSVTLPVTTDRILQLASAGANAGLSGEQLAIFTRELAKLATILPSLSEEQVRGILRVAALTDFPVERIGELNGALVRLQQTTKATLPQLITLSQRVAQDAGIFGASTEQVTALAATIADLGLQPERASTAIGRIVGQLKQLDSLGSEALRRLTNTFRDQTQATTFLETALRDPVRAFEILGEQTVNAREALAALQVTGKQNVIGQNVLKNIDDFTRILGNARLEDDIIDDQVDIRLREFNSQFTIFKNNFATGLRELGAIAASVLLPIIEGFNNLASSLRNVLRRLDDVKGALLELDFVGIANIIDGTDQAIEKSRILTQGLLELREENELANRTLTNEGLFASQDLIALIDQDIDRLRARIAGELRAIGVTGDEAAKALEQFQNVTTRLRLTPQLKAAREELDRLNNLVGQSLNQIRDLDSETSDLQFELSIFNLSEFEQDIRRIARDTQREFDSLLGGAILNDIQRDTLQNRFDRIAGELFIDLDLSGSISDVLERIQNVDTTDLFSQDIRRLQQLEVIGERLRQSQEVTDALQRRRNAELDLLLRQQQANIEKERQNIVQQRAPGISAITDTGSAIELLNQQQNDFNLQQEQLDALDEQIELQRQTIQAVREAAPTVATRAP